MLCNYYDKILHKTKSLLLGVWGGAHNFACGANYHIPVWFNFACGANYHIPRWFNYACGANYHIPVWFNYACGANYHIPGWFNYACGANYPYQALKGGLFFICVESTNLTSGLTPGPV